MKTYSVKEAYVTLQGEGAQTGRAAVFLRFSGCNLWSGLEKDRAGAICNFCDTDFVGTDGVNGGKFKGAGALAAHVKSVWMKDGPEGGQPYVICTGGEPLLQLDEEAIAALHAAGFEVGVETNGTILAPPGLDWICVSPKANAPLKQASGNELKLVYPQTEPEAQPSCFEHMQFEHFFLQPKDDTGQAENIAATAAYCMKYPKWRLSLQTHKLIGLP
ncbi:7-carboxy-7-deazaguanine synthase [Hyphomonas sp. FCG-A18]|uniref:7-carboxy-7-deazaguanine synthase n=1 Tax=Hyphomonas sp. FCG-A18 TaxID=3080019 RepID=UPI002B311DFB|nr:7-carboxy-7-deazaguanine synthase [Hyphomonas sp. FCG-A18]